MRARLLWKQKAESAWQTAEMLPLGNDHWRGEFPVANELRTGLYEADANNVYMPLATLQAMRKMDAAKRAQPQTNRFEPVLDPKTNLMVFIRPTILHDEADARFQTSVKYKYIQELQREMNGSNKPRESPFYAPNAKLLMYRVDGTRLHPVAAAWVGRWPQGIAFSSDGKTLASGPRSPDWPSKIGLRSRCRLRC